MAFDTLLDGMGFAGAVNFEALVHLRIEGAAAQAPRLAPGAEWVRHLIPALARSGHDANDFSAMIVAVKAVYAGCDDPDVPPDTSQSDFVTEFQAYVIAAFEATHWADLPAQVDVREEWRPGAETRLEIGIYAMRGTGVRGASSPPAPGSGAA